MCSFCTREIESNWFYLALADSVDNMEMSEVFVGLAKEELEHKAQLELELMKAGLTVKIKDATVAPSREYIVSNNTALLSMDYKDILLLCIEKEEASFRTYVNLLPTIHEQSSREILLGIAEEEVKHKYRFEVEYELLLKSS